MKVGDVVTVEDNDGNKKRGEILKLDDGDAFGVLVKYEVCLWFNRSEVKLVDAIERLGEVT